jgi:hypothetical protein
MPASRIVPRSALAAGACLAAALLAGTAAAQREAEPPAADASALAKQTQNPVGDLVSVPFQLNFSTGGDLSDRTSLVLNVQPVVPVSLTPAWNVILRTIFPFVDAPAPAAARERGLADVQAQLFFTPKRPGAVIWGAGPVLSLPVATADAVRTGSWAAGPTAVVLAMPGPFVLGVLASQLWTFEDAGGSPEVDQLLVQYFVNYNLPRGWAIVTAPSITASWDAPSGERWTVPFGIGLSKTTALGKQPLSLGAQYYYGVERPAGTGASLVRLSISLLFPTATKR